MTDSHDYPDNRPDTSIPRRTMARTAKLASLPLGIAGRAVGGWGRRLAGQSAEDVNATLSAKAAEQLFEVLGTLKGGAMKFGQALSVFEAAVPEEFAAPYRDALTRLQSAAPPMSSRQTRRVLAEQLGRSWTQRFANSTTSPLLRRVSARCIGRSGMTVGTSRSRCSIRELTRLSVAI